MEYEFLGNPENCILPWDYDNLIIPEVVLSFPKVNKSNGVDHQVLGIDYPLPFVVHHWLEHHIWLEHIELLPVWNINLSEVGGLPLEQPDQCGSEEV